MLARQLVELADSLLPFAPFRSPRLMAGHFVLLCQPHLGKQGQGRGFRAAHFLPVLETRRAGTKEKTPIALFNRQIFLKFPVSARHWAGHWGQVTTNDEDAVLTELPFSYGRPNEQIDR